MIKINALRSKFKRLLLIIMATDEFEVPELNGKTPTSVLQVMCTKRGITPKYELISNEGAVHEPLFRVIAGEYIGNGKGTSKKKAKHNAALDVLTQIVGLTSTSSLSGQPVSSNYGDSSSCEQYQADNRDIDARNPIGELNEMTQKRKWAPPVYDFTDEISPAHTCEFVCTVKLLKVTEKAVGKSKKLAKRNAALTMLNAVRQGCDERTNVAVIDDDEYYDDDYESMHLASLVHDGSGQRSSTETEFNKEDQPDVPDSVKEDQARTDPRVVTDIDGR